LYFKDGKFKIVFETFHLKM